MNIVIDAEFRIIKEPFKVKILGQECILWKWLRGMAVLGCVLGFVASIVIH